MCEDASSFDLSSFDVACCLEDIIRCIDTKKKEKESLIGGSGQCRVNNPKRKIV